MVFFYSTKITKLSTGQRISMKTFQVIWVRQKCPLLWLVISLHHFLFLKEVLCSRKKLIISQIQKQKLVYIHEDKNQENYKIYNFGANRTAEEDNEHLKLKDPLLEQGMEWAEKMGDVSFMEWGGGKKADRTHLERMRRAIMLDEAFYEKGITIKRAR